MNIVIVGVDQNKINSITKTNPKQTEVEIKEAIFAIVGDWSEEVNWGSGGASGVDTYTKGMVLDVYQKPKEKFREFKPRHEHWDGHAQGCFDLTACYGFRARNVAMAEWADKVYAVSFYNKSNACYHCERATGKPQTHMVNGGCWTMRYAETLNKEIELIVV